MFGDLTVFARPAVSATPDDSPTFPLYLLPSINLPFRRRRPKDRTAEPIISTPADLVPSADAVPSLSTSPSSPSTSPPLRSYFPDLPSLGTWSPSRKTKPTPSLPSKPTALSRAQPDTLRCLTCSTDIAFVSQIVSKGFTGRHGRAFLVAPPSAQPTPSCPSSPVNDNISAGNTEADLINVRVGRPENRQLVTGQHVVADIWCLICDTKLGWKYVDAKEQTQKYKVGKFILETQRVVAWRSWENVEFPGGERPGRKEDVGGDVRRSMRSSTETGTDIGGSRDSEESDLHDDEDGVVVFDSEDEDECDDIFAGTWDPEVVARRRRGRVANIQK